MVDCAFEKGEKKVDAAQQEQVQKGVQASAAWSCSWWLSVAAIFSSVLELHSIPSPHGRHERKSKKQLSVMKNIFIYANITTMC